VESDSSLQRWKRRESSIVNFIVDITPFAMGMQERMRIEDGEGRRLDELVEVED
jgi:hypothetical protein